MVKAKPDEISCVFSVDWRGGIVNDIIKEHAQGEQHRVILFQQQLKWYLWDDCQHRCNQTWNIDAELSCLHLRQLNPHESKAQVVESLTEAPLDSFFQLDDTLIEIVLDSL